MDEHGRRKLQRELQGLGAELNFGDAMREALERDGFELTYARREAAGSWMIRAKPPQEIQEGFGLAPEILLLAIHGEVQGRDLQRAADEVVRSNLRLDANLVVVTDNYRSSLVERLARLPGRGQRIAWVWAGNGQWRPLSEVLRERLPTYDVFDEHDPVRGNQLMGRDAEIAELRTRIVRGDAIGVFGLRKMGKTSLVRAVTDWLDPASGMKGLEVEPLRSQGQVLWVDAETLAPEATADDVADELFAALRRRTRAAGGRPLLEARAGVRGLKAACESLLENGERLCFVIDEYDLLFEREGGRGAVPGLSYLFRLLRAWGQQWQGAASLTLIGRDPEHYSLPQLDGVSNPLLGWFKPMWLGPLSPPHDAELLRRLGRRVGLEVGDASASLARHWSGGHPMLHREFGAALREEAMVRNRGSALPFATDPHCEAAASRFIRRRHVRDVDREIFSLLRKRYPAARDLLLRLVAGAGVDLASGSGNGPGEILRNFGLIDDLTHSVPQHLVWYAQTLLPNEPPALRLEGLQTRPERAQ